MTEVTDAKIVSNRSDYMIGSERLQDNPQVLHAARSGA